MTSSPQPIGVSVVAIFLLIGAFFSLLWIVMLFTSPITRDVIAETSRSIPALVFIVLVNAGLSLACGIGMLNGRNWARLLYIGFMPVMILLALFNGFRLTMLVGIAQYIIFAIILTWPSSVNYFTD
ncbi:MAG: hypothetical protein ABFD83_09040 [Armatimonadota bacterium]